MTIEELLKEAYLNGWNACSEYNDAGYEDFRRDYKEAINLTKREVIEDFVNFYNDQNEEAYTIFPCEVENYIRSISKTIEK